MSMWESSCRLSEKCNMCLLTSVRSHDYEHHQQNMGTIQFCLFVIVMRVNIVYKMFVELIIFELIK